MKTRNILSPQVVPQIAAQQMKVKTPEQAAAQAQLRGSVGGVQGILQIADNFKKGIINDVAAITILQEIFGFDEAIARNILGL